MKTSNRYLLVAAVATVLCGGFASDVCASQVPDSKSEMTEAETRELRLLDSVSSHEMAVCAQKVLSEIDVMVGEVYRFLRDSRQSKQIEKMTLAQLKTKLDEAPKIKEEFNKRTDEEQSVILKQLKEIRELKGKFDWIDFARERIDVDKSVPEGLMEKICEPDSPDSRDFIRLCDANFEFNGYIETAEYLPGLPLFVLALQTLKGRPGNQFSVLYLAEDSEKLSTGRFTCFSRCLGDLGDYTEAHKNYPFAIKSCKILRKKDINDDSMENICAAVKNDSIVELDLGNCQLSLSSFTLLAEALLQTKVLESLVLTSTKPNDEQLIKLCQGLSGNLSVTNLDLSGNGQHGRCTFGVAGLEALRGLVENDQCPVTHLNLARNPLTDDMIAVLADILKHPNCPITHLILKSCSISNNGGMILAEAVEQNTSLNELDVSYNNIGKKGLEALASALESNTTITKFRTD